jgi:hypothetical protein
MKGTEEKLSNSSLPYRMISWPSQMEIPKVDFNAFDWSNIVVVSLFNKLEDIDFLSIIYLLVFPHIHWLGCSTNFEPSKVKHPKVKCTWRMSGYPNENIWPCSTEQTCLNASESWTILCREFLRVKIKISAESDLKLLCLTSKHWKSQYYLCRVRH